MKHQHQLPLLKNWEHVRYLLPKVQEK
ncbi:Hypothetical protein LLA12_01195 [Lactococcus lactis subsp. lactis]|nr:Hypothetical protein LLA12_01195 [Lactococcus lactis subsp. lactis]